MTTVKASAGVHGMFDGCVMIPIDSSLQDGKYDACGVVFPPTHKGPRYLDAPFTDVWIPSYAPPMIATRIVPKIVNSATDHVVPQNSRQARYVPDSHNWLDHVNEEMA